MIALKMKLSTIDKSLVPNVLHFLWIGDLNEVKAHYIEIWQKTNKDKDVFFGATAILHCANFSILP